MEALQKDERYTYADYAGWDTEERYELIDGVSYLMSPAPMWKHQGISRELTVQLAVFLKGKPCEVFAAPFDVRLNADTYDDTVLQPDIVVICDRSKLSGTGCAGAPDMVIEILSPSSARHDRFIKFHLYQKAGVREYWIVDPDTKTVAVHVFKDGEYLARAYAETDDIPVHVLDGCVVSLADVFAE
jgi:Uma2 family endonuclease